MRDGLDEGGKRQPSGKRSRDFAKLTQSYSVEAMERLVEIMRNKKTPKLSLRACEIILDRAWGKAPQAHPKQ
jgi:hypothetical protein